jgi:DNA-directed RNA polymerase sigma subunit (sigma70/sigma32)
MMEIDQIENILRYHNQNGFRNDLKMMYGRITDMKGSQCELSAINYNVAVPANRNNVSTVEVYVVRNATITETEMETKELDRFINKLDRAIDGLIPNEKSIIMSRYFTKDGSTKEFKNVALECNYSEDWCKELNKRALEHIDAFLSGYKIEWQTL